MKINFDAIGTRTYNRAIVNENDLKVQSFSYRKPNKQQSTFFTQEENDADLIFSKNQVQTSPRKGLFVADNHKLSKQVKTAQIKDYFWLTTQIKQKQNKKKFTNTKNQPKQKNKIDIYSLTERLSSPINKCKQKCGATQGSHEIKKSMKQYMEIRQPQKYQSNLITNTKIKTKGQSSLSQSSKTLTRSYKKQLHNRLYEQWITKQFRDTLLAQHYQELYAVENHSKQKSSRSNRIGQEKSRSKFKQKDFKYVKFYDRLDELVQIKKIKADYIKNNLSIGNTINGQRLFKPDIEKSKHTLNMGKNNYFKPKTIKNRQREIQAPHHTRSLYEVTQTLNTSFQSLDKSIELIQNRQENFLKKIKKIFVNNDTKIAQISPQRIRKLTQIQFNIFFSLIQQLQSNEQEISEKQLYKLIKRFYKNLDTKDRQQLRKHEIQLINIKKTKVECTNYKGARKRKVFHDSSLQGLSSDIKHFHLRKIQVNPREVSF